MLFILGNQVLRNIIFLSKIKQKQTKNLGITLLVGICEMKWKTNCSGLCSSRHKHSNCLYSLANKYILKDNTNDTKT